MEPITIDEGTPTQMVVDRSKVTFVFDALKYRVKQLEEALEAANVAIPSPGEIYADLRDNGSKPA